MGETKRIGSMQRKWDAVVTEGNPSWIKIYSLRFSLLLSSYSAEQYTKALAGYIRAVIPRTIIVCRNGMSTGYVTAQEADDFALFLAKMVSGNAKVIKVWADTLIQAGKHLVQL